MHPLKMNKSNIVVKILINSENSTLFPDSDITVFDDIFRQPQTGGKKYSEEILLEEFAQFKNKKFEKLFFKDSDNVGLESDSRIVISRDDWDSMQENFGFVLKKGDLIVSVASNPTNLRIDEIKPTGFLNGINNLFFLDLVDNNKVVGGIK